MTTISSTRFRFFFYNFRFKKIVEIYNEFQYNIILVHYNLYLIVIRICLYYKICVSQ